MNEKFYPINETYKELINRVSKQTKAETEKEWCQDLEPFMKQASKK